MLIAKRTTPGYIGECGECGQGADTLPGWNLCDGCFDQADETVCGEFCKCECPDGDYHLDDCKCKVPNSHRLDEAVPAG